jgi:hypothetical protein
MAKYDDKESISLAKYNAATGLVCVPVLVTAAYTKRGDSDRGAKAPHRRRGNLLQTKECNHVFFVTDAPVHAAASANDVTSLPSGKSSPSSPGSEK